MSICQNSYQYQYNYSRLKNVYNYVFRLYEIFDQINTSRQHVCTADLHAHNSFRTPFFSAPSLINVVIESAFCSKAFTLNALQ